MDEYTSIKISQTKEAGKYLYKVNIGGEEVGSVTYFSSRIYENLIGMCDTAKGQDISPVKRCMFDTTVDLLIILGGQLRESEASRI